jgi:ribonuclease P protein component
VKLPRAARVRRRREFLAVQERGARLYSGDVLVLARPAGAARARIGITVSSKVANAVERNRVKRWVRQAFREAQASWPALDVVVVARRGVLSLGQAGVRSALAAACLKAVERAGQPAVPAGGGRPGAAS